jgi:hypothetical protein
MCILTFFYINARWLTRFIKFELNLCTFKTDSAVFKLLVAQDIGQFIKLYQLFCLVSFFIFQNFLRFFVAEAPV